MGPAFAAFGASAGTPADSTVELPSPVRQRPGASPRRRFRTRVGLRATFEERLQLAAPRRVTQLAQRLGLDLADPLARDGEVLSYFL